VGDPREARGRGAAPPRWVPRRPPFLDLPEAAAQRGRTRRGRGGARGAPLLGRARSPRVVSGFTLLEVMVALAILAGSMLAVSQMVGGALRNHTRAVRLEVATLLARGKLAAVQDDLDKDGFRDFDQIEEGTFEADGHPEVRWKLSVLKPKLELGPDQLLAVLAGGKADDAGLDLAQLLGAEDSSGGDQASGLETLFPGAGAMLPLLRGQLTRIGEQLKQGLREVRFTVAWKDGARDESFTVVTHLTSLGKGAP